MACERGSSALTTGKLGAAALDVICCTICSSSPRLATVRPTSLLFSGLQVEHDKLFGNGLQRDLGAGSAEVSMEPDLDGRTVRGLQSRHEGLSETF